MKMVKIDWSNHFVAFFATVLGIIIAFKLQDWQDSRKEKEEVASAISSLKNEVTENYQNIKQTLKYLPQFIGINGAILKFRNTDSTFICSRTQFDSLKARFPRFKEEKIKRILSNGKLEVVADWEGFIPPTISFENWEAVKGSGILYKFDKEKIKTFNTVYGFLKRNYSGISEDDLVRIQFDNETLDLKKLKDASQRLEFRYQMNLTFTDGEYKKIMTY